MKTTTLLTTTAAVLALATTAVAAPSPAPVSEEDLRPVSASVRILDAGGAVRAAHDCAWTVSGTADPGGETPPGLVADIAG